MLMAPQPSLTVPEVTLGVRLWMAREHHAHIKKNVFAALIGINRDTVTAWEADQGSPSVDALKKWASATGVSLRWLIDADEGDTAPTAADSRWYRALDGSDLDECRPPLAA